MAAKRGSLQAAALDGAVYALGGYDSKVGLASVELFDVRADRWRSAAPMTNARCYSAAVVHDGKVVLTLHIYILITYFRRRLISLCS